MSSIASGETLLQTSSSVRAEAVHQLELAPGAVEGAGAQGLGQALEVAERLQGHDLEAERGRERAHVLRAAVEVGEVVLEDLDAVIAGLGGGGELVGRASPTCRRWRWPSCSSSASPVSVARAAARISDRPAPGSCNRSEDVRRLLAWRRHAPPARPLGPAEAMRYSLDRSAARLVASLAISSADRAACPHMRSS